MTKNDAEMGSVGKLKAGFQHVLLVQIFFFFLTVSISELHYIIFLYKKKDSDKRDFI